MKKLISLFAIALVLLPSVARADIQQVTPAGGPVWSSGFHPDAYGDFSGGTQTDVVVTWTIPAAGGSPITGFQVIPFATDAAGNSPVRSGVSCSTNGSGTSCTVKGLAWATYYTFVVLATNSIATSSSASSTNKQASGDTSTVPAILTPGLAQTITLSDPPSPYTFGSADFQLTATASSGLPITWTSSPATTCTVDATGVVHFLKAQLSCAITATQYGSSAGYVTVSASKNATAQISLSATANDASAVQGTAATLNGVFPYPGADVTPSFCVVDSNPGATAPTSCPTSLGILGTLSTTLIDATSSSTSSAIVSNLTNNHQYWYWAIATSGASHAESNVKTFTTLQGVTLTPSGSLNGVVGTPMSVTFTATGGSGAYAAWDKGGLPAGLTISYGAITAVVSGTPTTAGSTLTFVYVEDSGGLNTNLPVTFVITASAPPPSGGGTSLLPQTITINNPPTNLNIGGGTTKLNATASSGLPVTWISNSPTVCAVTPDGTLTIVGPGVCLLTVSQAGNTTYSPATANLSIQVGPALQITLNEPTNVQSSSLELNATARWIGTDGTPQFCISLTDSNATCTELPGTTIAAPKPALVTSTSGSAITTLISGLSPRTIYYVWAQLSNGSLVVKTPTRMIHTSSGPTLTYSGETRRSVGSLVKLVVKASGGLAPYKNWSVKGLPAGITASSSGVTSLISGTTNLVGAYAIEVSVVDTNGRTGLVTIPLTIYDDSQPVIELTGATSQLIGPSTVQVKWEPRSPFVNYQVFLAKKLVCESTSNSCKIEKLLGPRAALEVYGKTATGTLSAPVHPTYIPPVKPIQINLVHFAFNSSALSVVDKKAVASLAKQMRGQGFTALMVVGHTDAIGSAELNTVLSGKRAKTTFGYLNSLLTNDPVSVKLVGKGFTVPVSDNATAKGRAANRRAAILVY